VVVGITAVALVALVIAAWLAVAYRHPRVAAAGPPSATGLARVRRQTIVAQTELSATLGYAGSYTVVNHTVGSAYTSLASVGATVADGQVLYRVDNIPVVLLYGGVPAYRSLQDGARGPDVAQLNADLVALGDAGPAAGALAGSDDFGAATRTALRRLQAAEGLPVTGTLPLGSVVFLPSAARVTSDRATLGAPANVGDPVLSATSTAREVTIALDASQEAELRTGNAVTITLPDGTTTPGTVVSVGTVATSGGTSATVPVLVRPTDPAATGKWDQAPVQVAVTTATATNATVVPVDALLALAGGGYGVEVAQGRGRRKLVGVSLGLFDDAAGLVQVRRSRLRPGQRVVVPGA
jgi:peptidoglycan hydrolase-like protein with peptidoglycan-binding domain